MVDSLRLSRLPCTQTDAATDFATRLRKRGESLVVITQSPANIEEDIRENSQNMFVFRLQDPKVTRAIAGLQGIHTDLYEPAQSRSERKPHY